MIIQVTPLTALKFAELSVLAGIPQGVINIVTGSGSQIGEALTNHPLVRKIGFTGSTEIGAVVMARFELLRLSTLNPSLNQETKYIDEIYKKDLLKRNC